VPLDATAVGRTIAHGAASANAQAKAAGEHEHEHKATDVWHHTANGMGHQGATDLLHLPPNDFTSTPLSDIPGALKMQAGDLRGAVADIGKAEGALATTGAVFGALTAAEQLVSVALSAIPFPAFPAVRIMDTDVGLPHAHAHPPNLVPPAPPVPLPSAGPVIPIPYVSGAGTVLINEMPAARCGDLGMGIWCGGYVPMFEIFLGSSSVWIEGARAARIGIDITKHCIFSDKAVGPMIGTTVSASPNVIIGGIPMPSLSAMAIGAGLKFACKGLGKLVRRLRRAASGAEEAAAHAKQTGAGGISHELRPEDCELAEKVYDEIRKDTTDVAKIAKHANMPIEDVQQIKNHVFHEEHFLDRYVEYGTPGEWRRFDASPEMANSWRRLTSGENILPQDHQLLQHELAESRYMKEHGCGYKEAHDHAQTVAPSPY
jgi:uncharacterized Zn-binding protein involved in type VI secretion